MPQGEERRREGEGGARLPAGALAWCYYPVYAGRWGN
jgi:hypothetical protein